TVVFLTSIRVGQETRRISARVSRINCVVRVQKPGVAVALRGCRPPLSPPPGGNVPRLIFRGGWPPGASGTWAPAVSLSSSNCSSLTPTSSKFFATGLNFSYYWQGYQDSNPDFRFWRPTC